MKAERVRITHELHGSDHVVILEGELWRMMFRGASLSIALTQAAAYMELREIDATRRELER